MTRIFKVVLEVFSSTRDTKVKSADQKNKCGRSGSDMVEFGEQLRRAREAKGMTQQSLAEQLYVTRQSVSRWECGDRYPDLLTTKKISQILEVSLDDLLSGKEMTKVVERNPVVENKVVNNIMIVLYAAVVFSYLISAVGIAVRMFALEAFQLIPVQVIFQFAGTGVSIAAFIYGLICAVRGTLSPKRMGAVLMAYFLSSFIIDADGAFKSFFLSGASLMSFRAWKIIALIAITYFVPMVLGSVAVFFFFVRSQNRKIWAVAIAVVSLSGIFYAVYSLYVSVIIVKVNAGITEPVLSVEYYSVRAVLLIAIYVLGLYQTYTLYKKRVTAADIDQGVVSTI